MSKKKLIEKRLPLHELSASAMMDKAHKGHPGNLHLWWNRSPITSSSALLFAAISDEDDTDAESLITQIATDDKQALQNAKKRINGLKNAKIADPFSGFGGLTIAAEQIGAPVVSADLNSVAVLLTKAAAEIPAVFADQAAVHHEGQGTLGSGSIGLAEDVEYYGKKLGEEAREMLRALYPQHENEECFSWVWVRSTECANPACKCEMPLSSSYILSQKKDKEYWAEPLQIKGKTLFNVNQGICPKDKETNKVGSMGAKFVCPFCGEVITDEYVKKQGSVGKIGNMLMAVAVDRKDGREFYSPSEEQLKAAVVLKPDDLPAGELPNNTRWFSTPSFGMKEYKDLYTSRQLQMLCTLSDLIKRYQAIVSSDAIEAGMVDDKVALDKGGKGAFAYGQAVSVYLAITLGRMANYHSTICTWDVRKGNLRAAFTRQAIPMTWTYAEGNPFSSITGNYDSCLKSVAESIRNLPCDGTVSVKQEDGTKTVFHKKSVLFTELPYLDNVGYADLSDYFYIWLRRCLSDVYPELFEKIVTSKEELSSIPEHYGNDVAKAKKVYAEGIKQLFDNFKDNASGDYPSMVFFEYSRSDENAIIQGSEEESTWEMFLGSIIDSEFEITRIWPVRTEKANGRFESVRVLVVFRPREENTKNTRRAWVNILRKELPERLDEDYSLGIDEEDKDIVAMGQGLAIYTRYQRILNADGSDMNVHDALQLIHQEMEDYKRAHSQEQQSEENKTKEE